MQLGAMEDYEQSVRVGSIFLRELQLLCGEWMSGEQDWSPGHRDNLVGNGEGTSGKRVMKFH